MEGHTIIGDDILKSNKLERISLLVVILALGILVSGPQPALAQSSPPALPIANAAMSPGDYVGAFQFDMREMDYSSTTNGSPPLSCKFNDNWDFDVSGTIEVQVIGPTTGTISINPTRYVIYEIRDYSVEGSGIKCKMVGYISGNAEILFMGGLRNDYDPQTQSFKSTLTITNWSKQVFRNIVNSNVAACSQQGNEEFMNMHIQHFFDNINKFSVSSVHFYAVPNGDTDLVGAVLNESYEKSITMPGGWWEATTSGHWYADKEPIKPKGWKK
jgi:hypothetical protein